MFIFIIDIDCLFIKNKISYINHERYANIYMNSVGRTLQFVTSILMRLKN